MPEHTIFVSNNLSPPPADRDKESRRQTEWQYCCGLGSGVFGLLRACSCLEHFQF